MLDHVMASLTGVFDEILLVTNEPDRYLDWDATIVPDVFRVRSSLTGIHAGLWFARHPYIFAVSCDMPFLRKDLIVQLIGCIEPGDDVVVPETEKGLEPLCAVYSQRCLSHFEHQLQKRELQIGRAFRRLSVRRVPEEQLRGVDAHLRSFVNINTPEQLASAQEENGRWGR
jgi:molybdopterin-guanine dinucleotide biosynthesis protein A